VRIAQLGYLWEVPESLGPAPRKVGMQRNTVTKIRSAKRTRTPYVMKFLPQIALNSSLKRAKSEWY